jgi:hypothetical protein
MILPTKHVEVGRSLLGVGASILNRLQKPRSVTALWEELQQVPEVGTFERFTLGLDLLYAIGAVQLTDDGLLRRNHG